LQLLWGKLVGTTLLTKSKILLVLATIELPV